MSAPRTASSALSTARASSPIVSVALRAKARRWSGFGLYTRAALSSRTVQIARRQPRAISSMARRVASGPPIARMTSASLSRRTMGQSPGLRGAGADELGCGGRRVWGDLDAVQLRHVVPKDAVAVGLGHTRERVLNH